MAHSVIRLERDGVTRTAPVGFSWTVLFFNFLVPLIRGHVVMGAVMLAVAVFSFLLSAIVFAFFYNRMYLNYLLDKGYRFKDIESGKSREELEEILGFALTSRS